MDLARIEAMTAPDAAPIAWIQDGQRPDGGFPGFWSGGASSVDATCFRLGQAECVPRYWKLPAVGRGLDFLSARQAPGTPEDQGGWWEEDPAFGGTVPPWLSPGAPEPRLYLTANAGSRVLLGGRRLCRAALG